MIKAQSLWFKGIPKSDHERWAKELLSYRNAFDALGEVLAGLEEVAPLKSDYDSPSWAYKKADRNGANRAYATVRKLLNVQEE